MPPLDYLAARIDTLERALHRTRLAATLLTLGWLALALAAFAPRAQDAPAPQVQEEIVVRRLVLTDSSGIVVLVPGPESSLILRDRLGRPVMQLGGQPLRRIGH